MFDDLSILFRQLPEGSIYLITCNRELKLKETGKEYTKEQFKDKFGDLTPFHVENDYFTSINNFKTIREMLNSLINKILKERGKVDKALKFQQLFNFKYQEYRGANMYTYGGVIVSEDFESSCLNLNNFEFVKYSEDPYLIDIPNLTRKEIELINSYIFEKEPELLKQNIITEIELEKYKKTYKYIPHFYDIRI